MDNHDLPDVVSDLWRWNRVFSDRVFERFKRFKKWLIKTTVLQISFSIVSGLSISQVHSERTNDNKDALVHNTFDIVCHLRDFVREEKDPGLKSRLTVENCVTINARSILCSRIFSPNTTYEYTTDTCIFEVHSTSISSCVYINNYTRYECMHKCIPALLFSSTFIISKMKIVVLRTVTK